MNIFDLQATISLNTDGFMSGVGQAQAAMNSFAGGTDTKSVAIGTAIGNMATQAAGALVDFGKEAMQTGMSFDTSMANVAAISGATADELEALRAKAKEMGASTKFTATEAADAFSYMAMAGWDASQMMDGISGIMNLAAASGEDLSTTSDIVTDALTAFGLKAEDSGHFADVLAAASSAANTNVHMMGETFKYVAPVAGALGYSVEDMATAIGTMANSGIKGSQAGTALRAALSRLVKPTKEVTTGLSLLGLDGGVLTDADGNMRSFGEVVDVLQGAFAGLDEATTAEAAAMIFGQEAMSGMLAIVGAAPEEYDKLADTIASSSEAMGGMGTAAEMAEKQLANLPGQLTLMDSAFDGLKTAVYEKIKAPLEEAARVATGVFSDLTAAVNDGGILGAFESLGGILADNLGPAFGDIADKIAPFKDALAGLSDSIGGGFSESLATIAGAVKSFIDAFADVDFGSMDGVAQAAARLIDAFKNAAADRMEAVATGVSAFVDAFRDVGAADAIGRVAQGAKDLLSAFLTASADVVESVSGSVLDFVGGFVDGGGADAIANVAKNAADLFGAFLSASSDIIEAVGEGVKNFLDAFPSDKIGEIIGGIASSASDLFAAFSNTAGTLIKEVANAVKGFIAGFDNSAAAGIIADIAGVVGELFGYFSAGFAGIIERIGEAFEGFGERLADLWNTAGPSMADLGEAVHAVVENIRQSVADFMAVVQPVAEWLASVFSVAVQFAFETLVQTLGSAFNAAMDIITTVQSLFAGFVSLLHGDVAGAVEHFQQAWENIVEFFGELGDMLTAPFKTLASVLGDEGNKGVQAIKAPFEAAWAWFKDIGGQIVEGLKAGISAAWSGLTSWFSEQWNSLVGGVKDFLGMHSPSRLFADIGKNMVLGVERGWGSEFGGLESQVDRDVRRLTDTARIGFEDSAIGRSSAAGISSMFAANEGGGRGDPVSINLVLDGDVAATALYDPLRRTAFQRGQNNMEAAYA